MKSVFTFLKQIYPFLKPNLRLLVLSALLALPLATLGVGPVVLLKYFGDDILGSKDQVKLLIFPIAIIGIFLVNLFVRFFHYYLMRIVIIRINRSVKEKLYQHFLGLSADYFTSKSTGSMISRVGMDPNHLDGGVSSLITMVREPLKFIALFGSALYLNWWLTLIVLLIFPLLAWVFVVTGRNLKRYIILLQERNADLFSNLQETFSGISMIKIFRLENYTRRKFKKDLKEHANIQKKAAAMEELSHPMVELITAFALAGVLYLGGGQVIQEAMTQGELLAFFGAFALMIDPIRKTNEINIKVNTAAGACERIFESLQWQTHLPEAQNPIAMGEFQSGITFENVSFCYPNEPSRVVLNHISFELPKGKSIALVGESGAGKSSVVNLLSRIYDVSSGKITIDGKDIRDLSLGDLRKQIAVVSQDIFLFNDTIEENVRCGKLDATDEEIQTAIQKAHAQEFIQKLPKGMKTRIGDRGQKLSGGERQRISIARAFLRKSSILILDEATSNLDSASEKIVQEAIQELMKDRTCLIIAHRLSTIRNANQIIVLKNGRVVETGKHEELVQRKGEYAHFLRAAESAAPH